MLGFTVNQCRQFVTRSWERGITVLTPARPLVTSSESFEIACRLGELSARRRNAVTSYFGRRAEVGESAPPSMFPRHDDRSFGGHMRRIARQLGDSRFLLYARALQDHVPLLVERAADFLAPLQSEGLRWRHVELELYVGRYDWTPIGVHREACGNFHHVIAGTKRILIWSDDAFEPSERDLRRAAGGEHRTRSLVASATARRGSAGKVIYFPSNCWHVGISTTPSVAIDIALYELESR